MDSRWKYGKTPSSQLRTQISHLDRDDLGASTDVTYVAGERVMLRYNLSCYLRGTMTGDFNINVSCIRKKMLNQTTVSVTLIDVNPRERFTR